MENNLEQALKRLSEAGHKLNFGKWEFGKQEVDYLGHLVGNENARPSPEKIEAIHAFQRPQNAAQLQRFLGLASYYRRFVNGFSRIANPLR